MTLAVLAASSAPAIAATGSTQRPNPGATSTDLIAIAVVILVVFIAYLLPLLWVLISSRSSGGAKFGWFIVTLVFSWVGLAVFLIITQVPGEEGSPAPDTLGQRFRRFG